VVDNGVIRTANDAELHLFYTGFFARFHLYPVIVSAQNCTTLLYKKEGSIAAALSLFDPSGLKQSVVVGMPRTTTIALTTLRILKPIWSLPALPKKGTPLKLLYVRYFGYEPGEEGLFLQLINAARGYAFDQGYHFVTVAIDEKDRHLNTLLKPVSRFQFGSAALITSLQKNTALVESICENILYEDYSLV
jgi:acetolactate synthase small subunit